MSLQQQDRITVEKDGEEIEVFNWATVDVAMMVRPGFVDHYEPRIFRGDDYGGPEPDAITPWLAAELESEGIQIPDSIDVIDPESDEVTQL